MHEKDVHKPKIYMHNAKHWLEGCKKQWKQALRSNESQVTGSLMESEFGRFQENPYFN